MIVITSVNNTRRHVQVGDRFCLKITDGMGSQVVIEEEITVEKTIDFIASYRFALEDGTCPGFHLSGIFGCRYELPIEIQNAVMLEDLTPEQHQRFIETAGVKLVSA